MLSGRFPHRGRQGLRATCRTEREPRRAAFGLRSDRSSGLRRDNRFLAALAGGFDRASFVCGIANLQNLAGTSYKRATSTYPFSVLLLRGPASTPACAASLHGDEQAAIHGWMERADFIRLGQSGRRRRFLPSISSNLKCHRRSRTLHFPLKASNSAILGPTDKLTDFRSVIRCAYLEHFVRFP
jgi:hypothetical protein